MNLVEYLKSMFYSSIWLAYDGRGTTGIDLDTRAELSHGYIKEVFVVLFYPLWFVVSHKSPDMSTASSQQNWVYLCITRFFRIVDICGPLDSQQEREGLVVRPS